jgi:hypothetical protein
MPHILEEGKPFFKMVHSLYGVWQYGLWSFQAGGTKLEIFLPRNKGNY